jgi:beta-glucanase (GH16 family)
VQVRAGQLYIADGTVTTFGIFAQTYGRFEIRCRVTGLHPGARLLPVSLGLPAIDIFAVDAAAPAKIYFANHWGTEQTERSFGDSFPAPDLSAAFHVISIEWNRDKITWFLDGKARFESVDGVPRQPMFLALSGSLDVDYVRVYQRR